ncbi:hypothetical protein ABTM73_19075, partial [Acinetobacter baumannii]
LAEPASLEFHIVLRLPAGGGPASVAVALNGGADRRFEMTPRWRTHTWKVAAEQTRPGLNELVIEWPCPSVDYTRECEQGAVALE